MNLPSIIKWDDEPVGSGGTFPKWMSSLPFQMQSTMLLAARGTDGIAKDNPVKDLHRNYRGSVLRAAKFGRSLYIGEHADSFMSLRELGDVGRWNNIVEVYFKHVDSLPHHYHLHLMHGAEILGYKHPHEIFRDRWSYFFFKCCEDAHLNPETEEQMDRRLCDWNHKHWDV
jgi:hypothetical protein